MTHSRGPRLHTSLAIAPSGRLTTVLRMGLGSFARGALAELSEDDLGRMLQLDETLFVEHKSNLREDSYKIASAVSSFANTLGGWLLIGITDGQPNGEEHAWAAPDALPLVDILRDRLRGEVDPLPSFEARVMRLPEGSVGVVRVYESSDTPHVLLQSGSVLVREAAGEEDVNRAKRPGSKARGRRIYEAAKIRSRAQLIELAQRGEAAARRARDLLDPASPLPLVSGALGLEFIATPDGVEPVTADDFGWVFVRVAPYTLPPRFRAWSTTADAAGAVLDAAEALSKRRGLGNTWIDPQVAGCSVRVPLESGARHRDALGMSLNAEARLAADGAGVVGAALSLAVPGTALHGRSIGVFELAQEFVAPVIEAALAVLKQGEFLGRALCEIDLVGLGDVFFLEQGIKDVARYVPVSCDLTLPADSDEVEAAARLATCALGRSGGMLTWDAPIGAH
jgi:Putative DNA-binding domain